MTHSGADIRALLDRHGLEARRSLGQNFVVDPNTVRRIAALAEVGPGDPIVEIGPGLGSLTLALLEHDASVTAIEMDTELVPILREVVAGRDVSIVEGDAQQVDWDVVLAAHPAWKLVANLPYNVATPLILDLLRDVPAITEMLVMVQLEVAERLAATAPDPAIGIPSVLVAYHGRAEVVGRVPPTVFHPKRASTARSSGSCATSIHRSTRRSIGLSPLSGRLQPAPQDDSQVAQRSADGRADRSRWSRSASEARDARPCGVGQAGRRLNQVRVAAQRSAIKANSSAIGVASLRPSNSR